jgi:hypothetical protein
MTIDYSYSKSSPKDRVMDTVKSLMQRARKAVITHDTQVIASRIRALRSLRFPTQRPRAHSPAGARRSPASVRRETVDSGGSGGDPDPEPLRSPHPYIYNLPAAALVGGAL